MEHPIISFAADEAWSVTTSVNLSGSNGSSSGICWGGVNYESWLGIQADGERVTFVGVDKDIFTITVNSFIGKNKIITLIADGAGDLSLYVDGIFQSNETLTTAFNINTWFRGYLPSVERSFSGNINAAIIRSQALTPSQVSAEASLLQSIFPEIPSVKIGTQEWSFNVDVAATCMGSVIPNVTLAADWADSQTLYDDYLTANPGDTYGATKAAAMWCYYDNDPEIGAVYSKLYNWYAVSLLQQDIDLYNAANPDNEWNWHVPTSTEFTTLQTYLGGSAVAGGKMKVEGLDYWNSPNAGASNSSGFSALGGGIRVRSGSYALFNDWSRFRSLTTQYQVRSDRISLGETGISEIEGHYLRLIKD
jgi:uncharacterized protein (TIGR02145 family)